VHFVETEASFKRSLNYVGNVILTRQVFPDSSALGFM